MSEEKEGESKELNLNLLKYETLEEIKFLKRKNNLDDKEVYFLSKHFFKKLLELDYEMTHEELIDELDKIYIHKNLKKEIQIFILNIGQIEYSQKSFSQDELIVLLDELKKLATELIHTQKEKNPLAKILNKLGIKKENSTSVDFGVVTEIIKKEEENIEEEAMISNIGESLTKSEKLFNSNEPEKAKEEYENAKKIYEQLSKEDQDKLYPRIVQAYNHLTN